jgi:hypothetical protein
MAGNFPFVLVERKPCGEGEGILTTDIPIPDYGGLVGCVAWGGLISGFPIVLQFGIMAAIYGGQGFGIFTPLS